MHYRSVFLKILFFLIERQRKKSSICNMARPSQSQQLGPLAGYPTWEHGPTHWSLLHCFPRYTRRDLDWKCGSWDLNLHPYGMSVLQVVALSLLPQEPICQQFLRFSLKNILLIITFNHLLHYYV